MRRAIPFLATFLLLAPAATVHAQPNLVRLADMEETPFSKVMDEVRSKRVVFVGEIHDDPADHEAQLAVIEALHQEGNHVAIGLEMMREENQGLLDDWVAGEVPPEQIGETFSQGWGWWPLYRPIFEYARDNRLPMLALNIPREIVAQVAREGFDSLRPEQMRKLGHITCRVKPAYEAFIRRALGGHGHGEASFEHFCEAQLVWDTVMAQNVRRYLDQNPQATLVVLAGSGHAWKYGIPSRLGIPAEEYAVILPVSPGQTVSAQDADYLWLHHDAVEGEN